MLDRNPSVTPPVTPRTSSQYSELTDSEAASRPGTPAADDSLSEDSTPLFSFDNERTKQAEYLLDKLAELSRSTLETRQNETEKQVLKKMQIRDACLINIAHLRQTTYIQTLKDKLNNHEKLTAGEYMIHALTTDNVNTLDITLLLECAALCPNQFISHINVLIALRQWQSTAGIHEKSMACAILRDTLKSRNLDLYLNLSGANLAGANLESVDFSYTNLENADLSHSIMDSATLNYCNLNQANLSYIHQPYFRETSIAPVIIGSTVRGACLDGVSFVKPRWEYSDFTSSSFQFVHIDRGQFIDLVFDKANFNGSRMRIDTIPERSFCSFKEANLAHTKLSAVNFKNVDVTEAILISGEDLECELDKIQLKTLKIVTTPSMDESLLPGKIRHRQNVIAENVLHHLSKLQLDNEAMKLYLEIAIQHPIFQPQSLLEQFANDADRVYHSLESTLFGQHRHHDVYRTKAMEMLEAALDRVETASAARVTVVNI